MKSIVLGLLSAAVTVAIFGVFIMITWNVGAPIVAKMFFPTAVVYDMPLLWDSVLLSIIILFWQAVYVIVKFFSSSLEDAWDL